MLLHIPKVLSDQQLAMFRKALEETAWIDGRATAGPVSAEVKRNAQLPEDHPLTRRLGEVILDALEQHPLFVSAALPEKISAPLFNRYASGQQYGRHVDGAIRPTLDGRHRIRTDLSASLFLSEPHEYEGGELFVEDLYGNHSTTKLPAGDMILYLGSSVHRVEPVTRGQRLASFLWIQSMIREADCRRTLFGLDRSIQQLRLEHPESSTIVDLTGLYHNLLRRWAEV